MRDRPDNQQAGWTPVLVHWEQWWDDDERPPTEVLRSCKRCFYGHERQLTSQARDGMVPLLPMLVSPQGIAHQSHRGDITDCGRTCSGPDWWHRA
jgi:hypothetical protein